MNRRDFIIASGSILVLLGLGRFAKATDRARSIGDTLDFGPYDDGGCVWNTGCSHGGITEEHLLFDEQIKVPICEKHLNDHMRIMALHNYGNDVEDIMEMSREERSEKVLKLMLKLGPK